MTVEPYRPGAHAQRRLPSRDDLIEMRRHGRTLVEIGAEYGVTRQAVAQALMNRPRRQPRNKADAEYIDPARPHLSWLRLVCEPELRRALVDQAERDQISLSEVVRRACRHYVGTDR